MLSDPEGCPGIVSNGPEQGLYYRLLLFLYTLKLSFLFFTRRFKNENREKKASFTCELSVGPEFADRVVGSAVDLVQQSGG